MKVKSLVALVLGLFILVLVTVVMIEKKTLHQQEKSKRIRF
ncbi:hypothetical protein [Chryseobacterium bernardetii]|nr:hypothetical protein [Chryseobacterium bernardetii]